MVSIRPAFGSSSDMNFSFRAHSSYSGAAPESNTTPEPVPTSPEPSAFSTSVRMATLKRKSPVGATWPMEPV